MSDLDSAVAAYVRGDVTLEALAQTIARTLREEAGSVEAVLDVLDRRYQAGDVSAHAYHQLAQHARRLSQANEAGGAPPALASTRVVSTAGPTAEPLSGDGVPTADSEEGSWQWVSPPKPEEGQRSPVGPGTVLKDRFVLERVIASGGMGVVYQARDLRKEEAEDRDPRVAIKILNEDFQRHPDSFRALQRETRRAQRLAHPNIVTVYDFDRDGPTVFMTMELLEGQSLDRLIHQRARPDGLPANQALSLIRGIAQGLIHAHGQGIVHSDLKPGNVFVTATGVVKLLDFGIARAMKRPGTDTTVFDAGRLQALTPAYASSEMLEGADPDPRDDVYALACMSYELLTGRHPFHGTPAVGARETGQRPGPVRGLRRAQRRALLRGLALERSRRTPSAERFLAELDPANPQMRPWLLGMAAGVVAAVAAGGLIWVDRDPSPASSPAPAEPEPVAAIDDPQVRAKVVRLLKVADAHLAVGRLTEPPGANAYEAYRRALELHPRDERARTGLQHIAARYAREAAAKLDEGRAQAALSLAEKARRVQPDDPALERLEQRIRHQLPAE